MYERNYSSPMGGDLYRLQQEARRREGETEDFVEHNPPRHRPEKDIRYDNKEYSHFDNKRPENILEEAKNIKPHKKKGGRDIFGKLFSNITIEDIILLGIILLLLQEDENNEIIIILAVILFMGLK